MADYYSLLSRAISNLPKSSPASSRKAIYDRARNALTTQLRSLRPQLPDSDIAREERALDEAVARLEAELEPQAASAPAAAPPPPAPPPPPPAPPARPTPSLAAVPPAPPPVKAPDPVRPAAPKPAAVEPATPIITRPVAPEIVKPVTPPATKAAPISIAPPVIAKPTPSTRPIYAPKVAAEPPAAAALPDSAPALDSAVEPPPAPDVGPRVDNGPPRPSAPGRADKKRGTPWLWFGLAALLGVVAAVAIMAKVMQQKPQDLAITEPTETASPTTTPGQKIGERVGGATSATTPTPTTSPSPTTAPSPSPTPTASPTASATPTPTPTSTPSATPTPTASSTPTPGPTPTAAIPVAARAAMLVATLTDAQKPAVNVGTVVWTAVPAKSGQPGSSGVKAEIDVPDLKMHATMELRKNVDPGLPASHTIDLRITFEPGSTVKGVKDIALPLMRRDDPPGVDALAGVRVKINDSYFLIGLNKTDADVARNVDNIGTHGWFDFPMQLSDDRIAKLTFEKAVDGDRIIADAIAAWK